MYVARRERNIRAAAAIAAEGDRLTSHCCRHFAISASGEPRNVIRPKQRDQRVVLLSLIERRAAVSCHFGVHAPLSLRLGSLAYRPPFCFPTSGRRRAASAETVLFPLPEVTPSCSLRALEQTVGSITGND